MHTELLECQYYILSHFLLVDNRFYLGVSALNVVGRAIALDTHMQMIAA